MEQLRQEIFEKVQQIKRLSLLRNNAKINFNKLKDKGQKIDSKLFKLKEEVRDLHVEYEVLLDADLLRNMQ
jgi:hypothetical protein